MKPNCSTQLKLTRARAQLVLRQRFFATLCLRLNLIAAGVPTMATNGKVIYYNSAFVDSLTPEELEGLLAHEVLHCALAHHCRRGTRDPRLWNEAADFAINPILLKNGFVLPAGALIKDEYEGLSVEEIYARRQQDSGSGGSPPFHSPSPQGSAPDANAPPRTQSQTAGEADDLAEPRPGGFGEVLDATDDLGNPASEAEKTRQEREWSIAAEQAMRAGKACGQEAADIDRPLKETRESKQDWRAVLWEFVGATIPSDYRWCPPNRRFVASGLYLPSVHREGVGKIVIGMDTSGSIGVEALKQCAGEISAISDQVQPEVIYVVYCDEAVNRTQEFGPSEPITLEPRGGGGTNFRPVFEWVEKNNVLPACLIYLTDLECNDYPDAAPGYPVLWVTDSRRTAPFGETLKILAD